ncbi:M48 family metalloprotease [Pseudoduganella sp. DS3]|uniref:M48 family metalloprotease n=1 Tax=Pseudoduganella guangdongensis TaxID=2692179 RepID=A0A6N9HKL3_9BURK|nr:M48 family metalloprotease [Pseudoduganella guangdongensis]MYN03532.1 M48 family metalloprotease [Pseudoduganella guangdongensis]
MRCLLLAWMAMAAQAAAQVPDSGRWQELRFSAEEVGLRSEDSFIELTVVQAAAGRLDRDRVLLARVKRITDSLVRAAVVLKPDAAAWPWEVRLTDDPAVEAESRAGGKLLLGRAFIARLALDDGELAFLLAHEIAHAVAEHARETLSEALLDSRRDLPLDVVEERLASDIPLQFRLSRLTAIQEREADQLGILIAHRAGWPSDASLRFYRKLAADEAGASLFASHPSATSRLSLAKGMSRLLGD